MDAGASAKVGDSSAGESQTSRREWLIEHQAAANKGRDIEILTVANGRLALLKPAFGNEIQRELRMIHARSFSAGAARHEPAAW